MNDPESIKKLVESTFDFIFEKGFKTVSFAYFPKSFGDWKMTFQSEICVMEIGTTQQEVDIGFMPLNANINKGFGVHTLVYFLSDGKKFLGNYEGDLSNQKDQLERLADLLKEYFESILAIMNDASQYYDLLDNAYRNVIRLAFDNYERKHQLKRYKPK